MHCNAKKSESSRAIMRGIYWSKQLIIIKNITKKFEERVAVDDVSLEIGDNGVFGLLGPNGAGKTTLIHILATLVRPTSGTAIVNGYDILRQPDKVRESIGIIFQSPSSDDMLTGYENLKIHAMLYGVPSRIAKDRISEFLELVELTDRKDDQVKKYSGGMRRRLEIARGLLHKPRVLFLDEPTLGLDPGSRAAMWRYIQNLVKKEKLSAILTTHYMEEAEKLCDRIGVMNRGKIIALDTPANLKLKIGGDVVEIRLRGLPVSSERDSRIRLLQNIEYANRVEFTDKLITLTVNDAGRHVSEILRLVEVENVTLRSASLNDVFLKMTGKSIHEAHAEGGFAERQAEYGN